ncbi:hypothetical protein [Candidatus Mycolicibacterium alkanivorans]|uniref:hypothetical protein n=1 Tax=Candidatus Mycolicibacterium alkanivorans TaxID=2954114 RepID=UPI0035585FDE
MTPLASIWDIDSRETHRPRVSVIVPALNEAKNLPHIAERMPAIVDEIVFVNGNNTDPAEITRLVGHAAGRRGLREGLPIRPRWRQRRHHPVPPAG